jgi:hypothetical protein
MCFFEKSLLIIILTANNLPGPIWIVRVSRQGLLRRKKHIPKNSCSCRAAFNVKCVKFRGKPILNGSSPQGITYKL